MDIAHRLFHVDSRNILAYLRQYDPARPPGHTPDRREMSILLCSALMRGAGQDWYEQGDVWNRVAENRPVPAGTPRDRLRDIRPGLRRLMIADAPPAGKLVNDGGPLVFAPDWVGAFEQAGNALEDRACGGKLSRGLRDVLAHHVIFHWNRIGLTFRTQSILAATAGDVVFGEK
jgi:thiopeptide-type bacteriocin biosynthesis protein